MQNTDVVIEGFGMVGKCTQIDIECPEEGHEDYENSGDLKHSKGSAVSGLCAIVDLELPSAAVN